MSHDDFHLQVDASNEKRNEERAHQTQLPWIVEGDDQRNDECEDALEDSANPAAGGLKGTNFQKRRKKKICRPEE